MKHIIKIGDIEIQKGLCTLDFNLISSETGRNKITHSRAYELLTSEYTKNVKQVNENKVSFEHGIIEFELYFIKE